MHVCNSYLACADPREFLPGGSRPDCQKTALKAFFVVVFFSPQLILQFYRGFPMVISKKTVIFQGLRWGSTISREVVQLFPGGSEC